MDVSLSGLVIREESLTGSPLTFRFPLLEPVGAPMSFDVVLTSAVSDRSLGTGEVVAS